MIAWLLASTGCITVWMGCLDGMHQSRFWKQSLLSSWLHLLVFIDHKCKGISLLCCCDTSCVTKQKKGDCTSNQGFNLLTEQLTTDLSLEKHICCLDTFLYCISGYDKHQLVILCPRSRQYDQELQHAQLCHLCPSGINGMV